MVSKMGTVKNFIYPLILLMITLPVLSTEEILNRTTTNFSEISINNLRYKIVPRGAILSFDSSIFYDKNSLCLKPESIYIFELIADIAKSKNKILQIEANTDEKFCNMESWEISIIRLNDIVDYFLSNNLLEENQIKSIGFGDIKPIKNRDNRIDFVFLNE